MISQNDNAYLEGLSEGWNPIQTYWQNPSPVYLGGAASKFGFFPDKLNGKIA